MVNPNLEMMPELFDQLVAPVLLYSSEIWGSQDTDHRESNGR